ncbi:hypothetical protein PssiTeo3_49760 [Pseudomonas sichuanensis]|nr:hypothetical protein [Pseudomonas sichuanensis]
MIELRQQYIELSINSITLSIKCRARLSRCEHASIGERVNFARGDMFTEKLTKQAQLVVDRCQLTSHNFVTVRKSRLRR